MSRYLTKHLASCQFHRWVRAGDPDHVLVAIKLPLQGECGEIDVRGPEADLHMLQWCIDQLLARGAISLETAADATSHVLGTSWARRRSHDAANGDEN